MTATSEILMARYKELKSKKFMSAEEKMEIVSLEKKLFVKEHVNEGLQLLRD
jgi:hypothetical protein